jgi:hypothetical protein
MKRIHTIRQRPLRWPRPTRWLHAGVAGLVVLGSVAVGGSSVAGAQARTLCVGTAPGCLPTLQAALDASHDGDVIRLGPGTFAGGVTITTSVTLRGAGAHDRHVRRRG